MSSPSIAELQLKLSVHGLHFATSLREALKRVGGAEIRRNLDAQARAILGIESATKKASGSGSKLSSILGTMAKGTIVTQGMYRGFKMVGGAIADTLEPLMEFQHNMAKVRAKGGLTAAQGDAASAAVKALTGQTQFSPTQASEAAVGLAAAGQGKNLATSMPTVLKFAQANDIAPEKSTEILLGVMGQFGKDIKDLEGIGDMITKADQLSVLSVTEIYDTLKYIGPLARDAKMPLQDVLALVTTLGDKGIKGSKAGTGARNLMTSLAKDPRRAKTANKLLKQAGFTRKDFQEGLDDPAQFLAKLDAAMTEKEWSPAKRMQANAVWFGQYGMTTSSALMAGSQALSKNPDGTVNTKITQDRAEIAAAALNRTLAKQAALMGSTVKGRLATFTAQLELLQIRLGEQSTGKLAEALESMTAHLTGPNGEALAQNLGAVVTSLSILLPKAASLAATSFELLTQALLGTKHVVDDIRGGPTTETRGVSKADEQYADKTAEDAAARKAVEAAGGIWMGDGSYLPETRNSKQANAARDRVRQERAEAKRKRNLTATEKGEEIRSGADTLTGVGPQSRGAADPVYEKGGPAEVKMSIALSDDLKGTLERLSKGKGPNLSVGYTSQ